MKLATKFFKAVKNIQFKKVMDRTGEMMNEAFLTGAQLLFPQLSQQPAMNHVEVTKPHPHHHNRP